MVERRPQVSSLVLAAALCSATLAASGETADEPAFLPLASLTFDRPTDSGPDTFRVFEQSNERVTRTREFRWSGDYSLRLSDARGSGDFPELLGFFPLQQSGQVFVHFALLVAEPRDEFNIALIGPQGFRLDDGGFAVWLTGRDGYLSHLSDSIPKRLVELRAFTWYQIDLLYDVDRGTYTLAVEEEGASEPMVQLVDQPNASNRPGSAVDKFSFVSDPFTDLSKAVYYVDDIVIGADEAIDPPRLVAPGRRRLFVEMLFELDGASTSSNRPRTEVEQWTELLRTGDYGTAHRFAAERVTTNNPVWSERAGDAALLGRDAALALEHYSAAAAAGAAGSTFLLKLADVHFLLGDVDEERRLREAIYGSIEPVEAER